MSKSAAIKLVRSAGETGSTTPVRIGSYREPLLAEREELAQELIATKGIISRVKIQTALVELGK